VSRLPRTHVLAVKKLARETGKGGGARGGRCRPLGPAGRVGRLPCSRGRVGWRTSEPRCHEQHLPSEQRVVGGPCVARPAAHRPFPLPPTPRLRAAAAVSATGRRGGFGSSTAARPRRGALLNEAAGTAGQPRARCAGATERGALGGGGVPRGGGRFQAMGVVAMPPPRVAGGAAEADGSDRAGKMGVVARLTGGDALCWRGTEALLPGVVVS